MGGLEALVALAAVFFVIAFIFAIIIYVLQSLGLYWLAKSQGSELAWLAWVPFGNIWLLGEVGGILPFFGYKIEYVGVLYLAASLVLPAILAIVFNSSGVLLITGIITYLVTANAIGLVYEGSIRWLLAIFGPVGIFAAGLKVKQSGL